MAGTLHDPRYRAVVAKLVKLRRAAGLTQRDLAELLGRPPSYVAKYELAERRLDIVELLEVLQALNADAVRLVRETLALMKKPRGS